MFKTLMTSTALTLALTAPSFAQEAEMDATLSGDGEENITVTEELLNGEMDTEMTADAEMEPMVAGDGEEEMTVTEDTLNAEREESLVIADGAEVPELDQLSQFTGMTVDEIVGLDVLSADGEDVGEIDYVYADGDEYKAVIGIGGFLGLGEYTVALPLGNFSLMDDELILDEATEAELDAMPEIDESELNELEGDYVIS